MPNTDCRTISNIAGIGSVALMAFGGMPGDPLVAEVKVGGRTCLRIVAPVESMSWNHDRKSLFESAVKEFARTHPSCSSQGKIERAVLPYEYRQLLAQRPAGCGLRQVRGSRRAGDPWSIEAPESRTARGRWQ